MASPKRIGVWFGPGLENALATRAVLGDLQAQHPGADWVLFGPRESLYVFEMDERVPVYIPLRIFEPRRTAQSRLSCFLEKRAQFNKLRALVLNECIAVAVSSGNSIADKQASQQFLKVFKKLNVQGTCLQKELALFLTGKRPTLLAGPQALAFATLHHRKSPPHLPKYLVLLSELSGLGHSVEQQWQFVQGKEVFKQKAQFTVGVVTSGNRLAVRHLAQFHPDWLQLSMAQAVGLIAYADGVISFSSDITQICSEMAREDLLLLGKSDS